MVKLRREQDSSAPENEPEDKENRRPELLPSAFRAIRRQQRFALLVWRPLKSFQVFLFGIMAVFVQLKSKATGWNYWHHRWICRSPRSCSRAGAGVARPPGPQPQRPPGPSTRWSPPLLQWGAPAITAEIQYWQAFRIRARLRARYAVVVSFWKSTGDWACPVQRW